MSCKLTLFLFLSLIFEVGFSQIKASYIEEVPDLYDNIEMEFKKNSKDPDLESFILQLSNRIRDKPSDAQALYYMGYLQSRLQCPDGSSIPKMTLNSTLEICNYFERSVEGNPIYKNRKLTLDPYSKIGSELSSLAIKYLLENKVDSAEVVLKLAMSKKGFSDFNIKYAQTLLENCPPNAILVTTGDLVTYPMLYCQIVNKVRPDVVTFDFSFLATNWYYKILKTKKNFEVSLEDRYIDSTLYINWNEQDFKLSNSTITVKPEYNSYLVRNNIILLDIIKKNEKRPILFTSTIAVDQISPFIDNLILTGFFYEFKDDENIQMYDIKKVFKLFDFLDLIDLSKYSDEGIVMATADSYLYKDNFHGKHEVCNYIEEKIEKLGHTHSHLRQGLEGLIMKNCKN